MATLQSEITAEVESVFLDATDGFAITITHYPLGVKANLNTLYAVWVEDELEGTNEVAGDGGILHTEDTEQIRRSGKIECGNKYIDGTAITFTDLSDSFQINSEMWYAKRIISKDADMQTVRVIRTDKRRTRKQRRRG